METRQLKIKNGFTLVEILVVVVILGSLAAIVIPQFSPAATEAKTSRVASDLQVMRAQIGLYKIQHNDRLPGSTAGVTFQQAMTEKTDENGALNPAGIRGPYTPRIPVNPFNELDTIEIDGALGGGSHGWRFSTTTGNFNADTDAQTSL
jgi:general secretion pathway protein G